MEKDAIAGDMVSFIIYRNSSDSKLDDGGYMTLY